MDAGNSETILPTGAPNLASQFLEKGADFAGVIHRSGLLCAECDWSTRAEMLPDSYQQVFLLRDIEELDINETAKKSKISSSLVKVRLHRARKRLRRILGPKLKARNTASKTRRQ